jgi:hypothetical protein
MSELLNPTSRSRDSTAPDGAARGRHGRITVAGVLVVAAVVIAVGAAVGLWYLPFIAGLGIGFAVRGRARVVLPAVAVAAMTGWAMPLLWMAGTGAPIATTAVVIAALAGLPGSAALTLAATMLVAAIQALAGGWLGRTIHRLANNSGLLELLGDVVDREARGAERLDLYHPFTWQNALRSILTYRVAQCYSEEGRCEARSREISEKAVMCRSSGCAYSR